MFLKVAERLDEYDSHYKFFSWIYRIAVNESLNLLRRNGREEALDDEVDIPGPDAANPESQASDAERSRHIQRALMRPVGERPDGADAAALLRMQLPGDRADPRTR